MIDMHWFKGKFKIKTFFLYQNGTLMTALIIRFIIKGPVILGKF